MNRIIEFKVNNKNVLIEKDERYISECDIKLAIEDIVSDSRLELKTDRRFDLSDVCSCMFSIIYKGIITTIEKIGDKKISTDKVLFKVCL